MRRIGLVGKIIFVAFLLMRWGCLPAPAANPTVVFNETALTGAPNNWPIIIGLASQTPLVIGSNIVFNTPIRLQPTNGTISSTLQPANYWVRIAQLPGSMLMPVPDSTNVYQAVDLISQGLFWSQWVTNPGIAGVSSVNSKIGAVQIQWADVTNALGYIPLWTSWTNLLGSAAYQPAGSFDAAGAAAAAAVAATNSIALTNALNAQLDTNLFSAAGILHLQQIAFAQALAAALGATNVLGTAAYQSVGAFDPAGAAAAATNRVALTNALNAQLDTNLFSAAGITHLQQLAAAQAQAATNVLGSAAYQSTAAFDAAGAGTAAAALATNSVALTNVLSKQLDTNLFSAAGITHLQNIGAAQAQAATNVLGSAAYQSTASFDAAGAGTAAAALATNSVALTNALNAQLDTNLLSAAGILHLQQLAAAQAGAATNVLGSAAYQSVAAFDAAGAAAAATNRVALTNALNSTFDTNLFSAAGITHLQQLAAAQAAAATNVLGSAAYQSSSAFDAAGAAVAAATLVTNTIALTNVLSKQLDTNLFSAAGITHLQQIGAAQAQAATNVLGSAAYQSSASFDAAGAATAAAVAATNSVALTNALNAQLDTNLFSAAGITHLQQIGAAQAGAATNVLGSAAYKSTAFFDVAGAGTAAAALATNSVALTNVLNAQLDTNLFSAAGISHIQSILSGAYDTAGAAAAAAQAATNVLGSGAYLPGATFPWTWIGVTSPYNVPSIPGIYQGKGTNQLVVLPNGTNGLGLMPAAVFAFQTDASYPNGYMTLTNANGVQKIGTNLSLTATSIIIYWDSSQWQILNTGTGGPAGAITNNNAGLVTLNGGLTVNGLVTFIGTNTDWSSNGVVTGWLAVSNSIYAANFQGLVDASNILSGTIALARTPVRLSGILQGGVQNITVNTALKFAAIAGGQYYNATFSNTACFFPYTVTLSNLTSQVLSTVNNFTGTNTAMVIYTNNPANGQTAVASLLSVNAGNSANIWTNSGTTSVTIPGNTLFSLAVTNNDGGTIAPMNFSWLIGVYQ